MIDERSGPPFTFAGPGDTLLDTKKIIVPSDLGEDLTHSSVTMPLREGDFNGQTVWYILTEPSDFGLAHDLNPRHANAYSPLWDAQVGEWSKKVVDHKFERRQDVENEILDLAAQHSDLLTGPVRTPYGSSGFVIDCATVPFTEHELVIDYDAAVAHS